MLRIMPHVMRVAKRYIGGGVEMILNNAWIVICPIPIILILTPLIHRFKMARVSLFGSSVNQLASKESDIDINLQVKECFDVMVGLKFLSY